MKKVIAALIFCSFVMGCGSNNDDKERIQADSAAINAKPPDSSFNETNNHNAHAGLPGSDSAEAANKDSVK